MRQHVVPILVGAVLGVVLATLLALMIPVGRDDYSFVGDGEGSALLDYAGPMILAVGIVAGVVAGLLVSRRRSRRN